MGSSGEIRGRLCRRPPRSGSGVWPPAPERVDCEARCDSSRRSCPVSSPGGAARSAGESSACSRRSTGPAPGGTASPPPGRDRRKRVPRIFCLGSSPPSATWARRLCSTRPAATSTGHPLSPSTWRAMSESMSWRSSSPTTGSGPCPRGRGSYARTSCATDFRPATRSFAATLSSTSPTPTSSPPSPTSGGPAPVF